MNLNLNLNIFTKKFYLYGEPEKKQKWIEMKNIKGKNTIYENYKYFFCEICDDKIRKPYFLKCEDCIKTNKAFCEECVYKNIFSPIRLDKYCKKCMKHKSEKSYCTESNCLIIDCKYCLRKYGYKYLHTYL